MLDKKQKEKLDSISVNADYIYKNATRLRPDELVKTDLLLYYLSIIFPKNFGYKAIWYPDCSVYNRGTEVLPKLASKRYFEKAKVLFGVNNVEEYKNLVSSLKITKDYYDGYHVIPKIKNGLSFESVATI